MNTGVPFTAVFRLHSEPAVLTCCFRAVPYTHWGHLEFCQNDVIAVGFKRVELVVAL